MPVLRAGLASESLEACPEMMEVSPALESDCRFAVKGSIFRAALHQAVGLGEIFVSILPPTVSAGALSSTGPPLCSLQLLSDY